MQHLKLADDLVSDSRFNFKVNELNRKDSCYRECVLWCDHLVQDHQVEITALIMFISLK